VPDSEFFLWRPVLAKVATLQEIETHYSIMDLAELHDWLDYQQDIEAAAARKVNGKEAKRV